MAITVANAGTQGMHSSNRLESASIISVTGDSSYVSGGYASFASAIADYLPKGATAIGIVQMSAAGGYHAYWDRANDKLQFYVAAGTEVPGSTDLSGVSVELLVLFV